HSATSNLLSRRDVIIVASVSCIYGLGSPEEYKERVVFVTVGEEQDRDLMLRKLIDIQYVRNDTLLGRGKFRVKGDVVEIQPAYSETAYRVSFFCNGIENYSRILDGRPPGSAPHTLLDYFPSDYVVFIDESHQTVPQIGGMYEGDRSRKQTLVDFGFRLPSALDNRPLRFDEFLA